MPSTANNPMEEAGIASHATKRLVEEASEEIGTAASALHGAARELDRQRHRGLADSIDQAAQGLEWLAGSLNGQSLRSVLGRAETLARRQPVVFYAGALAAGFLLSRFLKSSGMPDSIAAEEGDIAAGQSRFSSYRDNSANYEPEPAAGEGGIG